MSNINIRRAVENIRSGTNVYTPIVELIVNAIQAVRELGPDGGVVNVTIQRASQGDLIDGIPAVDGFVVEDDGVGFNQKHRESFDTLYTERKADEGGKGFGRFTCLKYFERMTVSSVFRDESSLQQRQFAMGLGTEIIVDEVVEDTTAAATGSKVTISGTRGVKFPDKGLDVIARVLVERLLPYFIDPSSRPPRVVVRDGPGGPEVVLNDYLGKADSQIIELAVDHPTLDLANQGTSEPFFVRVFKFYAPRTTKSKVSLVAHRREVTETPIQTYIPEFSDEFFDRSDEGSGSRDRNYIIKAYVFGAYLDRNVSLERGAFHFPREGELMYGVSQVQIEAAAAEVAKESVGTEIAVRRERKQARIEQYIENDAPWHRSISREADFTPLPMNPSAKDIEIYLQTAKFQKEITTRAEVHELLTSEDPGSLSEKVSSIVASISQTSKSDLIHYVSTRRCVLDLFRKALETDEVGKYRSEGDVHDIILPRKADSDHIDYEEHNLWILDERLNFANYFSSDLPINGARTDRTDISVFDKRVAFRGDNVASNPITIFEFKRPNRHDFANPSSDEDPIAQIVRYVNAIRDGAFKTPKGREMLVTDTTPFYGYVVCDLSKKVTDWLRREKNFKPMPDGLGWFDWFDNNNLYIEVLSWTKVLNDAEMRSKVFFHKLGILPTADA